MVGPRTVDFGKVSMGSTNTRHLVVHNTLEHYINVVLDIKHLDMLRDSPATSQVIPPGARAAFPLVLQVRGLLVAVQPTSHVSDVPTTASPYLRRCI